jgi:hypothetical protein
MTSTRYVVPGDLIWAAVQVVAPGDGDTFHGTLTDATDVMVQFARDVRLTDGGDAQHRLTRMLLASQPSRVAEIAAAALLRLADAKGAVS